MPFLKKLSTRIMLPFLVLFLMVSLISLLLNRLYISRLMDERISRQTDRISRVLSNSEFVFNPIYLNKLKDIIEGDVIVFEKSGKIAVSTLSEKALLNFSKEINIDRLFSFLQKGKEKALQQVLNKSRSPFLLIARPLSLPAYPRKDMILCIVSPLADVLGVKAKIANRMFLVGSFGLLLAFLFGYIISRSVARPIKDLVVVTGDIANGNFESKAPLPSIEEIRMLASSINSMTDKLREYEKQIVRSSQLAAAGKVTAAMAHEIRNPLSSIKMMTQLLRNRLTPEPENTKLIESLLEEIGRVERIVKDLTDLMRPSELSLDVQNINDLIEEILPVIKPRLAHRKISVKKDLAHSLPRVHIDKDKIKQVIWNLMLNAMDSMPDGGVIKVVARENRLAHRIEVVIEDEGDGINKEALDNIFAHFFTTKPEGLGLGLSTSREIVESHKGSLTVENMEEKGVRAMIFLPIKL